MTERSHPSATTVTTRKICIECLSMLLQQLESYQSRVCSALLNWLPFSWSPLGFTQDWQRNCFASKAVKDKE